MASIFHSFSVPTSPAMTRAPGSNNNNGGQPVTPQRLPLRHHQHRYSHSAYFKSPNTPSSDSTQSTLATPDTSLLKKRHVDVHRNASIDNSIDSSKDKSLADLAQNWRARANQHGIKVSPSTKNANDSHFGDDEISDKTMSDIGNDSSILSNDEALLPAPFMSYHRRSASGTAVTRPRALSHASLPENKANPSSPLASRNPNISLPLPASPVRSRRALGALDSANNVLRTPPPNRTLSSQLKMKGSLTDPPQLRKRENLGSVPMSSANLQRANMSMNINLSNKSLELFDINEHDLEYETDIQSVDEPYDESFSLDLQNHTANIFGYSGNLQQQHHEQAYKSNHPFADPFHIFDSSANGNAHVLSSIAESVEHHFHTLQPPPNMRYFSGEPPYAEHPAPVYPTPTYGTLPQTMMPVPMQPTLMSAPALNTGNSRYAPVPTVIHSEGLAPPKVELTGPPTECSVCLASYPPSLAVLQPCSHPLCSSCLTSALNIVGEKDMECAVCKTAVADFKLVTVKKPGAAAKTMPKVDTDNATAGFSFAPSKENSDATAPKELESAFEFGFDFADGLRASTPKLEQQATRSPLELSVSSNTSQRSLKAAGKVVLRIDNVPWDITPRQIVSWLKQPVDRVHVLLDSKGKTLSHAYVEVKDSTVAGAILRGETAQPNAAGRRERGSVLGRGKRARGVTITRSSEEELMANLFPSWSGRFDGARPSLAGLEGEGIIRALEAGLLTEGDLVALRRLIEAPDSHFLKVPVLPFHSLLSILSKFPTDIDSRVFWSAGIRDKLFDLVVTGIQALIPRIDKSGRNEEYSVGLVLDLAQMAMNCKAFTPNQVQKIADVLSVHSLPVPSVISALGYDSNHPSLVADSSHELGSRSESGSMSSILRTPENRQMHGVRGPVAPLNLKELGVPLPEYRDQSGNGLGFMNDRPFDDIAKEFGVDAGLVQALAQRLAGLA